MGTSIGYKTLERSLSLFARAVVRDQFIDKVVD